MLRHHCGSGSTREKVLLLERTLHYIQLLAQLQAKNSTSLMKSISTLRIQILLIKVWNDKSIILGQSQKNKWTPQFFILNVFLFPNYEISGKNVSTKKVQVQTEIPPSKETISIRNTFFFLGQFLMLILDWDLRNESS